MAATGRLPARLRELKREGARSEPAWSRPSSVGECADDDDDAVGEVGRVEASGDEGRDEAAVGRSEASLGSV